MRLADVVIVEGFVSILARVLRTTGSFDSAFRFNDLFDVEVVDVIGFLAVVVVEVPALGFGLGLVVAEAEAEGAVCSFASSLVGGGTGLGILTVCLTCVGGLRPDRAC